VAVLEELAKDQRVENCYQPYVVKRRWQSTFFGVLIWRNLRVAAQFAEPVKLPIFLACLTGMLD
jgi:hypothetical protein